MPKLYKSILASLFFFISSYFFLSALFSYAVVSMNPYVMGKLIGTLFLGCITVLLGVLTLRTKKTGN